MRRVLASLAVGALIGIGLGVLVHRFLVLPADLSNTTTKVLLGAAISAGIASSLVRKQLEEDRSWPARVGGGVAGVGVGLGLCALLVPGVGDLDLERQALPGFSIGLPDGEIVTKEVGEYGSGQLLIKEPGGWPVVAAVAWGRGGMDDETEEMVVQAAARAHGAEGMSVVGRPVWPVGEHRTGTVQLRGEVQVLLTYIECGARLVTINTTGSNGLDLARLHRRILASFACAPDPAQELDATTPPPVALDLPGDWSEVEAVAGQRAWEGEHGGVLASWAPPGPTAKVPRLLEAMFGTQGPARVAADELLAGRQAWAGEVTLDGQPTSLVATIVPCPGAGPAMLLYLGDSGARGREILATARCDARAP